VFEGVVVAPWNDIPRLEAILERHGPELAASSLSPSWRIWGASCRGMATCSKSATSHTGVALFILDEVVTGFRYAPVDASSSTI